MQQAPYWHHDLSVLGMVVLCIIVICLIAEMVDRSMKSLVPSFMKELKMLTKDWSAAAALNALLIIILSILSFSYVIFRDMISVFTQIAISSGDKSELSGVVLAIFLIFMTIAAAIFSICYVGRSGKKN